MERPFVGVGIVIERDNQVLLLKRKNVHGEGTWSTPGGYLEYGESPEECAQREAEEETGLVVEDVHFIGITNDVFSETNKHFITIWMKAASFEGVPKINAAYEMSELKWFSWTSLPSNLFLPFKKLIHDDLIKPSTLR